MQRLFVASNPVYSNLKSKWIMSLDDDDDVQKDWREDKPTFKKKVGRTVRKSQEMM